MNEGIADEQLRERLLANVDLLAEAFKRTEEEVERTVLHLHGKKEEMLNMFLVQLNLPLNVQSLVLLNSISKQERGFWGTLKSIFK
ncbi:MAG: hypothetical protein AAF518_08890 [Spirochaetota bacterium]